MKLLLMALRNLTRQTKRTALLGGAIAFGVFIVTLIEGFAGSFVENVGENFSQLLAGHIFVEGVEKGADGKQISVIRDESVLIRTLEEQRIRARYTTRRTELRGTLIFQGRSVSQNIVGVDWGAESYFQERLSLLEGSFDEMARDERGIIVSQRVAEILNVEVGEPILVKLKTLSGQQNVGEFRVAAVSYDPNLFAPLAAYADRRYVNELLGMAPGEYKTLGIFLTDLKLAEAESERYYEALRERAELFDREKGADDRNAVTAMFRRADEEKWEGTRFRLYTINDVLEEVQQIVTVLNRAALVILLVLFVIIMVGITNTFRMIMFERIREIGTMRALGMQRGGVRALFLLEALFLALAGAAGGLFLAALVMAVLSRVFWGLDTPIFILLRNGYMTFRVGALQVLANVGIVAGLTILAAFFPARKAARMKPVDALRAE